LPRYDTAAPIGRLFVGVFAAFFVVIFRHVPPKYSSAPVICNGGWEEALFVFVQLVAAAILIELVSWAIWYVFVRPKVRPARPGIDDPDDYVLSGGQFLGPKASIVSIVLACILGPYSLLGIGIPDPCTWMEHNKFSTRTFAGGLVLMYAIMMASDYAWGQIRNASGKTSR
jgi:hypothetical protein